MPFFKKPPGDVLQSPYLPAGGVRRFRDVVSGEGRWCVKVGNALDVLKQIPTGSVQCCLTSPPYYGLRDYGVEGQFGNEGKPAEFVDNLTKLFRIVRKTLHPTGTVWLNLGDSYSVMSPHKGCRKDRDQRAMSGMSRNSSKNNKAKNLLGIPWKVAFALQEDGWYLRQWMPWVKRNPMPDPAADRPGSSCETFFLLSKSSDYLFDMEAVKRKSKPETEDRYLYDFGGRKNVMVRSKVGKRACTRVAIGRSKTDCNNRHFRSGDLWYDSVGRLLGLDVPLKSNRHDHFASMPTDVVRPLLQATTEENSIVLDPFTGSGTTGVVALQLGRKFVGTELNPNYLKIVRRRMVEG